MERKEIFIEWSGPYTYEEIIDNKAKENFDVKPNDFGLYQIYGRHTIYGDGVLLYVGKTEQKFCERLKGRGIIVDNLDSGNIQIYLGRTYYDDTLKHNISADISRAESLLIHYHKPGHNSSNINSLKYANEDIRVFNIGSYRALHSEVSTIGFIKEQKIYSIIDHIAKETQINRNKYNEEDGYGYWLDENLTIWFGVDYTLWNGNTTLVLMSDKKIDNTFKELNFSNSKEDGFCCPLSGAKKDIIKYINLIKNKEC